MRHELLVGPLGETDLHAVGVEVVEQPPGLVLLDVEAGEAQQASGVVTDVDDLRRHADLRAALLLHDGELGDVEAEVVEPADARVEPVPLAEADRLRVR